MAAPSILLLDCSKELEENLIQQGFDVESGTIGFISGERKLPCQIYEKDVIIYNPDKSLLPQDTNDIGPGNITDLTPQFNLGEVHAHVQRGATVLAFVKPLTDKLPKNMPYHWIPAIPQMSSTMDKLISIPTFDTFLKPILAPASLKLPVLVKIDRTDQRERQGLFFNQNNDHLGQFYVVGQGEVLLLPDFESNEEIIQTFLHRVLPEMRDYESKQQLIEKFLSPVEKEADKKVNSLQQEQEKLDEKLLQAKKWLADANRQKHTTIKADDTATLILNYYDIALQQADVSLFYLYKVIEALELKLGGEKAAKEALKKNEEWNNIGKLANTSYADIRHAPRPGEKIRQWTTDEIKKAFMDTESIIDAYLQTLF